MTHRTINRTLAAVLFFISEVLYLRTMAPTFSFWDCGEFIATAYTLGIPHPPGSPLFLLLGRLFSMIPFFHDIGARVNLISTLASAATIMLTYLITVRLIGMYRKSEPDLWSPAEKVSAYGGAVIGSLALAFSDSFWFNAVEAEVYALSSLFTALVVWLILRWYEEEPKAGHERWLMLVMYIIGLSIGVHLLSLLAVFAVALVYYFKKNEVRLGDFLLYLTMASLAIVLWATSFLSNWSILKDNIFIDALRIQLILMCCVVPLFSYFTSRYFESITKSKTCFSVISITFIIAFVLLINFNLTFSLWGLVTALVYGSYLYFYLPKSFSHFFGGSVALFFLIYIGIIKGLPMLLQRSSWWGFLLFLILLGYSTWYTHRHRKAFMNTLLMSLFLIIIGYTSYGMIYVRAQAGPPINENNPSSSETFVSYLNRDQYGDMPLWPRRWSPEPVHQYFYQHYSSDLDYFVTYQMKKMYFRYFGWQFIGREHDMEGAGVDWSVLWGLPFLVGMVGAVTHFRREWKMGLVVTALFVLTGAALVIYLNQTEPQPRERDYSYVGSFFAFALWIGIGVESIWQWLGARLKPAGRRNQMVLATLTVATALLLINGRMLWANYRVHDRSGNYVPWDWAWNLLQSCEKDAILFTNGDNDTFPLWYLQEVERIRTDVRVVNLSLANTGWYLDQLKNSSPRGAKPVAFTMTDGEIADITYVPIDSVDAELPSSLARQQLLRESRLHGVLLPSEPLDTIKWLLKPGLTYNGQGYLRPQDIAVYEILMNNFSRRPIYFALTVDPESMIGLENYLRLDGLAYKVVPIKSADPMSYVDSSLLYRNLVEVYRYRNLNNRQVNLEETSRRLCGNYTPLFVRLALDLAAEPDGVLSIQGASGAEQSVRRGTLALQVLDTSSRLLPLDQYPLNPELAGSVIALYVRLGEKQKTSVYIAYLEKLGIHASPATDPRLFYVLARAYRDVGRKEDAKRIIASLARELKQPGLIDEFTEPEVSNTQMERDVLRVVETKGGFFPVYKSGSDALNLWKSAYLNAKRNGMKKFVFKGLKYRI